MDWMPEWWKAMSQFEQGMLVLGCIGVFYLSLILDRLGKK
jgi:hypothetical protein